MSTVTVTHINIEWPTGSVGTPRLAGLSTLEAPAIPLIESINTVDNVDPGANFRISEAADIVIVGQQLDLVTAIQFEDYGPDNTGWPNYTAAAPLSNPVSINPDPADSMLPFFNLDSPTQITIYAGDITYMMTNYPYLTANTWYKLVLTY